MRRKLRASKATSLVSHLNLAMTSTLDLHAVGNSILETIELLFPECYHDQIIELGNREFGASGVLQFG